MNTNFLRAQPPKDVLHQFSAFHYEIDQKDKQKKKTPKKQDGKAAEEENEGPRGIIDTGRSWTANELRIKSNDDLHKLWYVFLKEKNSILSDGYVYEKIAGEKMPKSRMFKLEKSIRRLQAVLQERKIVCSNYQRFLEDEYSGELREKLDTEYSKHEEEQKLNPPISYSMLRAKFESVRVGKDNLNYIDNIVKREESKQKLKDYLKEKYAYGKKKVINPDLKTPEEIEKLNKDEHILKFRNSIEEQLKENKTKISQEEVLRAHVKNWRALDLKQRRVVLDYLNARRSRDAKSAFVKELNMLAQKIAYEEKKINVYWFMAGFIFLWGFN